jgi:hypothetical protein
MPAIALGPDVGTVCNARIVEGTLIFNLIRSTCAHDSAKMPSTQSTPAPVEWGSGINELLVSQLVVHGLTSSLKLSLQDRQRNARETYQSTG